MTAQRRFDELRKIRNELAHGVGSQDSADLARRLAEMGVAIPASEAPGLSEAISEAFSSEAGLYHMPSVLPPVVQTFLAGREAQVVLDPCAGLGAMLATVRDATHAARALAFTRVAAEAALGKALVANAEWETGDPLQLLGGLKIEVDVVASVLPFGGKQTSPISVGTAAGDTVELRGDLGSSILAAASVRLSPDGIGLFVVPASFFFSERSMRHQLDQLGVGIEAALALPFGAFAPYANIQTYLVVIHRRGTSRLFVGQLSTDVHTNLQIIDNFKQKREGGTLELGRFVPAEAFTGLAAIRLAERFTAAEQQFGAPAIRLQELATSITLGRSGEGFEFPDHSNAIFIPLIGNSGVAESLADGSLKPQNYAQVVIDPQRSDSRFVARFLNSEFGREIRELSKSGSTIPRLNKRALEELRIFIPDLRSQKDMLQIEAQLAAEQNTLRDLQNEIAELRRELWFGPQSASEVERRTRALSQRLSGNIREQSEARLDQWCETLPFPLASIFRAWQATPSQDFKGKLDHLLHFFGATAEFVSIILLSTFGSNEAVFAVHRQKMAKALQAQNLSFLRSSFGTWKVAVEYLGKQTRMLLAGDPGARALCADLFADPSLVLPKLLGRKEIGDVLSTTNKLRNDWKGHGGVLGQEEAQLRNEQLLGELQQLREAMADVWTETQLIHALHCRPRRGVFENEIAILTGSNSEFLKETRAMSMWLDVERLYVTRLDSGRALPLLPLVRVGPSPRSAKNACYFFNRLERDRPRFVSYHFTDMPELKDQFEETTEAIKFLSSIETESA